MSFTKIILQVKPRSPTPYVTKFLPSFQICHYSKKQDENVLFKIDPKVKELQHKLLYSDYLSYEKRKLGYTKRVILRKSFQEIQKKQQVLEQLEKPVYSVIFNRANNNDRTSSAVKQETEDSILDNSEPRSLLHMPYASTDSFRVVDVSTDDTDRVAEDIDKKNDKSHFSVLNEDYKALYEKYLESKNLIPGRNKPNFIEYEEGCSTELQDFKNIPRDWMNDYEQYDDALHPNDWLYGTSNENSNISQIPCGGCGALLHCKDHALPGYIPSEILMGRTNEELKIMVCQRCHFMKHYNTALDVKVSPEDYPELLKVIKTKKCAVILMIDLTDFPCSIWQNIGSILHPRTSVFLVGNKFDLLPKDSSTFEVHVKECLSKAIEATGIQRQNIKHIALISAKTEYGIEELINKLHKFWKYKGDVYLVGCTNVGKSSLFNGLLLSDYCKVQAADLVRRATISPWPGTTLNLLKFPITNPVKWRLYLRTKRLQAAHKEHQAAQYIRHYQLKLYHNIRYATPEGAINRTFRSSKAGMRESRDPFSSHSHKHNANKCGIDETDPTYIHSHWCYDTPGTIQSDQILDLLTTEELIRTLPNKIISPRTFVVQPEQTVFIGGLGRLDYLEGNTYIRCTIFASNILPITMCHTIDADDLYNQLLHTEAFTVPINNPERLKVWPSLQPKQMEVTGISETESAADVVLSNAGWIAITPKENEKIKLQGWTPDRRGIHLRVPALLKKSVTLRGARILGTPAYKRGRQVYTK